MDRSLSLRIASFSLAAALVWSAPLPAQSTAAQEVLNNGSVVQMFTAKLQKSLIITKIQSTKSAFDVSADGLISLTQNKVPQDVIKAMMIATTAAGNRPAQGANEVLTNDAVVQMITGKVAKALILDKINGTKGNYDITTNGLVSLNANKVPQDVIKAMMAKAGT